MMHGCSNLVAGAYFEQLREASSQAIQSHGKMEHKLLVAGQPVLFQFAGPVLEPIILPALRHLISEFTGNPGLTVQLWDSASTGITFPPLPWDIPPGESWRYQTDQASAIYFSFLNNMLWLDREKNLALFWTADAADLPITERGSPLQILWAWWLASHNIQLVHAAAVSGKDGAALLLGPGGSGKSTTALLSLSSPLQYLGDDYCLISTQPAPHVFSLYSSGKVNTEDGAKFPWLAPTFAGQDQEKVLFQLYPALADRIINQKPLRALLATCVTGKSKTTIEPISSMEAMRAVGPNTLIQLRMMIDPEKALRIMAEIAEKISCYRLNLGTDRDQIPTVLIELLDH